jgi:hypothetical protein
LSVPLAVSTVPLALAAGLLSVPAAAPPLAFSPAAYAPAASASPPAAASSPIAALPVSNNSSAGGKPAESKSEESKAAKDDDAVVMSPWDRMAKLRVHTDQLTVIGDKVGGGGGNWHCLQPMHSTLLRAGCVPCD